MCGVSVGSEEDWERSVSGSLGKVLGGKIGRLERVLTHAMHTATAAHMFAPSAAATMDVRDGLTHWPH